MERMRSNVIIQCFFTLLVSGMKAELRVDRRLYNHDEVVNAVINIEASAQRRSAKAEANCP
jgi:hypothetical protein